MNIKIIGSNCSNGIKLKKNLMKLNNKNINYEFLSDKYVQKYNVKNIPALIINEKVVSEGKVLNEKEINRIIKVLA